MEADQYLTEYYKHREEDRRLTSQHGSVEFLTTMRYIEKYLKPADRIIEIGAGTGRYSHALARQGYRVDAVELVQHKYRKEDIDDLMSGFAVKRLHYVAADGYTNHMRETVDNMDKATFELYLKYHFTVCERADMAGLTNHALDIFRKDRE